MDHSDALQIPEKLYGREREIEMLFDTYEEVHTGQAVLLLVAGYSGVGKTSLIQEIQKPILAKRGFFVSGKFDQFTRNIPYAALISAF